jgi:hypothetical protein
MDGKGKEGIRRKEGEEQKEEGEVPCSGEKGADKEEPPSDAISDEERVGVDGSLVLWLGVQELRQCLSERKIACFKTSFKKCHIKKCHKNTLKMPQKMP